LANSAGRSGPSAIRAAPVSVAKSMISSGLSSPARVSASPSTSRPSASVLSISTVSPRRDDHVAGAEGGGRNAVLDRRDEQMEPNRQPLGDDQLGEAERVRGAAHVLLHQPHAARRLDVEPAAVEAHALADDRDARVGLAAPAQLDQPRGALARCAAPDRGDHRIAGVERVAIGDLDLAAAVVAKRADRGFELGRAEVGRGGVDEVADQGGGLGLADGAVDRGRLGGEQDARAGGGVGEVR
jgi:hypothetical protein